MTKLYSIDQVDEVSSLVKNELRCVSISSVALDMGLSRHQSSLLLDDIIEKESMIQQDSHCTESKTYQVTKCVVTEEVINLKNETSTSYDCEEIDNPIDQETVTCTGT